MWGDLFIDHSCFKRSYRNLLCGPYCDGRHHEQAHGIVTWHAYSSCSSGHAPRVHQILIYLKAGLCPWGIYQLIPYEPIYQGICWYLFLPTIRLWVLGWVIEVVGDCCVSLAPHTLTCSSRMPGKDSKARQALLDATSSRSRFTQSAVMMSSSYLGLKNAIR